MQRNQPDQPDQSPQPTAPQGPFGDIFNRFAEHLQAHPEQSLLLSMDDLAGFRCQRGGLCCRNPWVVNFQQDYYDTWHERLRKLVSWEQPVLIRYQDLALAKDAYGFIAKQPDTHLCAFQAPDHSCMIHSRLGEDALPSVCKRYPRDRVRLGGQYLNDTLTSACEHAAAQLDKQADLTFEMLPATQPLQTEQLNLRWGLHQPISLNELLPRLGQILDQVMTTGPDVRQNLMGVALLLAPDAVKMPSPQAWPPLPSHQQRAIKLFLEHSPYTSLFNDFVARNQRLGIPKPHLSLRSRQRLQRFQSQYLLRRLINLDPIGRGNLTVYQYLWLLSFGLLTQSLVLSHRLREGGSEISLRDLVVAVTEWEMMGLQHPSWIYKLQLATWDDATCLQGLLDACGYVLT